MNNDGTCVVERYSDGWCDDLGLLITMTIELYAHCHWYVCTMYVQ